MRWRAAKYNEINETILNDFSKKLKKVEKVEKDEKVDLSKKVNLLKLLKFVFDQQVLKVFFNLFLCERGSFCI